MKGIIIQARMSSTRLKGKVLLPLGDCTVLEEVLARAQQSIMADKVVVATSTDPSDDPIVELLTKHSGAAVFRGDLLDVQKRYLDAAAAHDISIACRITADCPFLDATLIDELFQIFDQGKLDYIATNRPVGNESYPDGLDVEIFSIEALKKARANFDSPIGREHVTPSIWNNEKHFRCKFERSDEDFSDISLTIDTEAEYNLIHSLFQANIKDWKNAVLHMKKDSSRKAHTSNSAYLEQLNKKN